MLGGVDCSNIPGVADVACGESSVVASNPREVCLMLLFVDASVNGYCRVEACTSGYIFDFRKRTCVPNSFWNVQPQGHKE